MKKKSNYYAIKVSSFTKLKLIMRLISLLILVPLLQVSAISYSQNTKISIDMKSVYLSDVLEEIENQSNYRFIYKDELIDQNVTYNLNVDDKSIDEVLNRLLGKSDLTYRLLEDNLVVLAQKQLLNQQIVVKGKVVDTEGISLPGVNILEKGTTNGSVTNLDGEFSIAISSADATLIFSFVGYLTEEIPVSGQTTINITLVEDIQELDEVVVIGYGSMRKRDLTGAVKRVEMNDLRDQPNISVLQSLQGVVAGLNVSQVNEAGQNPDISIRGRTSLSGEQNPLIILDGVIYRGNLIDVNPNDIKSIDILKDNSATAVYGSQAANGVIIISTTTKSDNNYGRPTIRYSANYSFQSPVNELVPGNAEYFIDKITENEWRESRTEESGYIETNPNWDVTSYFKTNEQAQNYLSGMDTDWYDLVTNDKMFVNSHNLSLANQGENANYFVSLGYTDQQGYMLNEDYQRINARINIDSKITDWLKIGVQSFTSINDMSGFSPDLTDRYTIPFEPAYDENGDINPMLENSTVVSPLIQAQADNEDVRQTLFGNFYAEIDLPFIEGLTYKVNYANNQTTNRDYYFRPYAENWQGEGGKTNNRRVDMAFDNNLTYKRQFNNVHNLEMTLVYGIENRNYEYTRATASIFTNDVLGYNKLQFGSSELQSTETQAWEESSLFTMGRIFYSFKNKYLITGTLRRDGFSGFSENNKFGYFPSGSIGWVASEESFFQGLTNVMNYLKFRVSYGASGNRTVARYQTLAKVSGGYNYVDAEGNSTYTQSISSLASPNLKWETTTGINIGTDFGFLNSRINGSINYYNNNTTNLLYVVDIPSIGRFSEFPDNLGRIHNHGIELSVSSVNIQKSNFSWSTEFSFSRNRDKLKELLGADNDGDGKEDDLISENLFIGHSLNTIYGYEISGEKYQLGDEDIPSGFDVGTNKIVDQNDDGEIDPENDKIILGYADPSYRFSISNRLSYKNWSLNIFINSIQGGKDYYMQANDLNYVQYGDQYIESFPKGYDNYWLPENPNAAYQKNSLAQPGAMKGRTYAQRNFIRLQDVSLSYTFDSNLINKFKINNLRVFLSGKNLLTLTDWQGWDPETGQSVTRNGRPVLKSYTVGLNIEF